MGAAKKKAAAPEVVLPDLPPAAPIGEPAALEAEEPVFDEHHVVDPTPDGAPDVTEAVAMTGAPRRVRITRGGDVEAGGGHYTLRAGDIMVLGQRVADELIAQRMAEEA